MQNCRTTLRVVFYQTFRVLKNRKDLAESFTSVSIKTFRSSAGKALAF